MKQRWLLGDAGAWGAAIPGRPPRSDPLGLVGCRSAYGRQGLPSQGSWGTSESNFHLAIAGGHAPQTLSVSDMVTPGSLCPPTSSRMASRLGSPSWVGSVFSLLGHPDPTPGAYCRLLP